MRPAIRRKQSSQMLSIAQLYLAAGGTEPIDLDALAIFAINEGHWTKRGVSPKQLCKKAFSRAFREQYHDDPQGRQVRTYHAACRVVQGEQHVFWGDMRTAPGEHTEDAFSQRRRQIVGDCVQLKLDVDSFNDNNTEGRHYQLPLDFSEDVEDRLQPDKYIPTQPR